MCFVHFSNPLVSMWHLPTLIWRARNSTPEVSAVKAEAVINGWTLQRSSLATHLPQIFSLIYGLRPALRVQRLTAAWNMAAVSVYFSLKNQTKWGRMALGGVSINDIWCLSHGAVLEIFTAPWLSATTRPVVAGWHKCVLTGATAV